jgi:hypothetical protein
MFSSIVSACEVEAGSELLVSLLFKPYCDTTILRIYRTNIRAPTSD